MIFAGISCFYHDSSVAFVQGNKILFAMAEERLTRIKQDRSFPQLSFVQGMQYIGASEADLDSITFYEDPKLKLERLFEFSISAWPHSKNTFFRTLPKYYFNHYPVKNIVAEQLLFPVEKIYTSFHHQSHATAVFFTSPFEEALVVTVDAVGEKDTLSVFSGQGNRLKRVKSVHFPDSLGLFYSVFTHFLGFKPNSGEYKIMGLAPYGKPEYSDLLKKEVLNIGVKGYPRLNLKYFDFDREDRHFTPALEKLLGEKARSPESELENFHKNLAASVQKVLEDALFTLLISLKEQTKAQNICLGGGVALNCTFNGKLLKSGLFDSIHIHNACGDDAGALGAAIQSALVHQNGKLLRYYDDYSPYLGQEYSDAIIETSLKMNGVDYRVDMHVDETIAKALSDGKVVAVFHGRDEWGPRALGNRSILADPRSIEMKNILNAKIKFREEFRPFAPICLEEEANDWFETSGRKLLPDMLFTVNSKKPELLQAVTHVNGTARLQTLSRKQNPFIYDVIRLFGQTTGVPVLINTSFNLRGEPIVATASDALKTFFKSNIDLLVLNRKYVIRRSEKEAHL